MKLIGYELKKIIGVRYFIVSLIILLILNLALCVYTNGWLVSDSQDGMYDRFFEEYNANPDYYDEYYKKLIEQQNAWFAAINQKMTEDPDYNPYNDSSYKVPCTITGDENYNDINMITAVYNVKNSITAFPDDIQNVIDMAEHNLDDYTDKGMDMSDYSYRYQAEVISLYDSVRENTSFKLEYTRGWDTYFDYTYINIFIFAAIIIAASVIFVPEKMSGIIPLIRTSKYGRRRTAVAKIAALAIVTAAVALIFILSTMAVIWFKEGFSDSGNPIQIIEEFKLVPYTISIGGFFLIMSVIKLLAFLLFSMVILLISVLLYNYALVYASGLAVYGINIFFCSHYFINLHYPVNFMNIIAVADGISFLKRYRALNFFGETVRFLPFVIMLFGIILIAVCIAVTEIYSNGLNGVSVSLFGRITRAISGFFVRFKDFYYFKIKKSRTIFRPVFVHELYKSLISSRLMIVAALLIVLKIITVAEAYEVAGSYDLAIYLKYMSEVKGPLTEKKEEYITEEYNFVTETLASYKTVIENKSNMSSDEVLEYIEDYNYATDHVNAITKIYSHMNYIKTVKENTGVYAWFIYEDGWEELFGTGFDFLLYILLLLVCTGVFANEYQSRSASGAFVLILRTTKFGRKRTFAAKLRSAAAISALFSVIFYSIEAFAVANSYHLPMANAPLLSLEMFGNANTSMSVWNYIIFFVLLRLIAAEIFALAVCALSELFRKIIPVMCCAAAITLIPALLEFFGIGSMKYINFISFLRVTPLWLISVNGNLFGSDYGFLLLFVFICAALAAILNIIAKRKFIR